MLRRASVLQVAFFLVATALAGCGGAGAKATGTTASATGVEASGPKPLIVRIEEVRGERDRLDEQEAELVKAQVDKRRKAEHGELPPLERNDEVEPEAWPRVTVINNTPHGLIVWFAGPCARTLALRPRAEHSLELCEGTYNVAAELSAPDYLPFVGEGDELVIGYRYRLTFYVMVEPRSRVRRR